MSNDGFIGVVSDTHGAVCPEVLAALAGSELILHAGDIGAPAVLEQLREIAPLVAVRGNVDARGWAEPLPNLGTAEFRGRSICVIHNLDLLDLEPVGRFDAVVFGHTHLPECRERDGVLYFNPGSAGTHSPPVTVGKLRLIEDRLVGEVIEVALER
jgi:putative phosphoesterase